MISCDNKNDISSSTAISVALFYISGRAENCDWLSVAEVYKKDRFGSVPKAIIAIIVAVSSFGADHGYVTQLP